MTLKKLLTIILIVAGVHCNAQVWSVRDFGAKGDGVTKDTEAIQATINEAAANGGGTVEVPAGTYLSGSIELKDNIDLHLMAGAIIKGSPDLTDYCAADCYPQNHASPRTGDNTSGGHLIYGVNAKNITLRGPGKVDGNSEHFFLHGNYVDVGKKVTLPDRPAQMIWFADCENIHITDLEIANAPYWSCFLLNCTRVWIRGCNVHTEREKFIAHNGDGLDIDRCRYVSISDCHINTQDDCITLRASGAERLSNPQNCEFVTVTNCTLSSACNAIRLGVGEGLISEATFSNIAIYNTKNAFNIVSGYTRTERGTDITDILFSNIRVNAERLMKIHHMRGDEGVFRNITFSNISGNAPHDSQIWAKKDYPFSDITFRDIDVPGSFECINASVTVKGGQFRLKKLPGKLLKERKWNIENEKKLLY
jgi:polygalacturonase